MTRLGLYNNAGRFFDKKYSSVLSKQPECLTTKMLVTCTTIELKAAKRRRENCAGKLFTN